MGSKGDLTLWERIEGGILGLLVGDALGVPYEFHLRDSIPALESLEMAPPQGFARSHARVAPGTWSDDGAHALCLLASLLENERLDVDDFGKRLVRWYREGEMAVDGIVFDVGLQTERALRAMLAGVTASHAGPSDERSNGNGSLMRVLPLALWHRGDEASLVRDAHAQSLVTHGHPRAQACCALYCLWARRELAGDARAWEGATRDLRKIYEPDYPNHEYELVKSIMPGYEQPRGTGYVVDCLHSARMVCDAPSYEAAITAAIALGNDTDTTASVAGGIAGLRCGARGIPSRWLSALRGRAIVDPLLARLRARIDSSR